MNAGSISDFINRPSFSDSVATLWKRLPSNIRGSGSLSQFKRLFCHNFEKHDIRGNQVFKWLIVNCKLI